MIVRRVDDLAGTEREVSAATFVSRRFLLAKDKMGFSFHDTTLYAGTSTEMHYRNHLEAVYCVGGRGSLTDHGTGEVHEIRPGTMYALNGNEHHTLVAEEDLRMICVFNPALVGPEVHDETGAYPILTAVNEG